MLALVAAALLASGPTPAPAATDPPARAAALRSVSLQDNFFRPARLTVRRRDVVVFRWRGPNPHNVRAARGPRRFSSAVQREGSYRVRFTRRGRYRLACDVHPGMAMRLRVR